VDSGHPLLRCHTAKGEGSTACPAATLAARPGQRAALQGGDLPEKGRLPAVPILLGGLRTPGG
jgi:hypothetical protein